VNMPNYSLAIVIPAYKAVYLNQALLSITQQTNTSFNLYIGDDASPEDLEKIVSEFQKVLPITYVRFNDNLGSISLVEHWKRCIEMTNGEKWIWLFSDDDIMESNCVEMFKKELENENELIRIYRFNSIKFTDNQEEVRANFLKKNTNTVEYLHQKLNYINESYVIEYIFQRDLYDEVNGFIDFPLGWCSDDSFWIKCSKLSNIRTINNAKVFWRWSSHNISGQKDSKKNNILKLTACLQYIRWLKEENIHDTHKNVDQWILTWYLGQYNYLRKGLSIFEQIINFLPIISMFPFGFLKLFLLKKRHKYN